MAEKCKVTFGDIASLELPDDWIEGPGEMPLDRGLRAFRFFHPPDCPDAKLCFFYRGLPVSDAAARAFVEVLGKPPHVLTPSEIRGISEILAIKTKPDSELFNMLIARTEAHNGKVVLLVEGSYPQTQEDIREFYTDFDGTGRVVEEIYFQAPPALYMVYLSCIKDSMRTVRWKIAVPG